MLLKRHRARHYDQRYRCYIFECSGLHCYNTTFSHIKFCSKCEEKLSEERQVVQDRGNKIIKEMANKGN